MSTTRSEVPQRPPRCTPPRRLDGLLAVVLPGPRGEAVRADLADEYSAAYERSGPGVAWFWYARQLLVPGTWRLAYELRRMGPAETEPVRTASLLRPRFGLSLLDLKLGARMLRKQPMLTAVAVLALGLGIPASLSVTHLWHAQMAPMSHPEGDRVVGIRHWDVVRNRPVYGSFLDYEVWRDALGSFEAVGAARSVEWNVDAEDDRVEPVRGAEMTASAFELLRVPPLLGRTLVADDEVPGAPDVVVLSFGLWESRFGRDPEILGRQVRLSGVPHAVIGVMPDGFLFPRSHRLWLPFKNAAGSVPGSQGFTWVFGRLADGVSLDRAGSEVESMGARLAEELPETHGSLRGQVVTMPIMAWGFAEDVRGDLALLLMQLFPVFLLMVVCGNVGIMILARTASRMGELATRYALGANRSRIVSQLFGESLVLAVIATGLGLLAAQWAIGRYEILEGRQYPYWTDLGLGPRTVLLALSLAVVSAGVASVLPALKATRSGYRGHLGIRSATLRFGAGATALIVAEVALAVAALSGGVAWSIATLQATGSDMGIELDRYLSAEVVVPSLVGTPQASAADSAELRARLRNTQAEIKERIASEPGVRGVAVARTFPGEGPFFRAVEVVDQDVPMGTGVTQVAAATVSTDFFQDMGHPVLQGRDFTESDVVLEAGTPRAVIVNTTFVDQVLGGRSPIGRMLRYPSGGDTQPGYEIVGVVGPLGMNPVNPELDAGVYYPAAAGDIYPLGLVVLPEGDPLAFAPRLRSIAAEVDPGAMIRAPALLSELAARGVTGLRYLSLGAVLLSSVAIFLSVAGLYALMSFTISQRTAEIGVRTALGAHPWRIVLAVGKRAALQLTAGVFVGVVLSVPLMVNLSGQPSLRPDGLVFVVLGVAAGTLVVGALACFRPTLRGLRIQPAEALRAE